MHRVLSTTTKSSKRLNEKDSWSDLLHSKNINLKKNQDCFRMLRDDFIIYDMLNKNHKGV